MFLKLQWNCFWHCSGIVVFTNLSFRVVVVVVVVGVGANGAVVGAADIVVLVGAAVDAAIAIVVCIPAKLETNLSILLQ